MFYDRPKGMPTHGAQEGSDYHGYRRQRMYHPLLIFDGQTNQLVTAVLRVGATDASKSALAILRRIVRRIGQAWGHGVRIEIRADAVSAVPEIYDYCEEEGIDYTIGLVSNPRLEAMAEPLLAKARRESEESAGAKLRLLSDASYRAGSWEHPRRVIYKAEVLAKGTNTLFVLTTKRDDPLSPCEFYVGRGESEGWIKDFKRALRADRLSCMRFLANQFRLLLHAAAYWLLDETRRRLMEIGVRKMQLDTLRLLVVKIGGRVRQLLTTIRLHLASGHPGPHLWHTLYSTEPRHAGE